MENRLNYGGEVAASFLAVLVDGRALASCKEEACGAPRFFVDMYQSILAMVLATEEINQNPSLLPNVTLGFRIFDSCYSESLAAQGTMWLLSGVGDTIPNYSCQHPLKMAAIIGDLRSSSSVQVARMLGLSRIPQLSYGSGLALLSDKHQFPSFMRTNPSAERMPYVMAQLVIQFGWTWVGILASDSDYGIQGSQTLREELAKHGVCVAFSVTLGEKISERKMASTLEVIKKSTVTGIVLYLYYAEASELMDTLAAQGVEGKVWIVSHSLQGTVLFFKENLQRLLNGSLGITIHKQESQAFRNFLYKPQPLSNTADIYRTAFWEHVFECRWVANRSHQNITEKRNKIENRICTGLEVLESLPSSIYNVENFRYSYYAYAAVYVLVHALDNMLSCNFKIGKCLKPEDFQPWQLLTYVKKVHFLDPAGQEVFFDDNGDPPVRFDIENWQVPTRGIGSSVNVGLYDERLPSHQILTLNRSNIQWGADYSQVPRSLCSESCSPGYRKALRQGQPVCCFDCVQCKEGEISTQTDAVYCVKCPDNQWSNLERNECIRKPVEFLSFDEPLGAGLAAIAVLFSLLTAAVLIIFLKHRDTPIVRANNRALSYMLLSSLMLCFLCSLTFIGRPVKTSCLLRQMFFGVTFSFCVGCILAKTLVVVIAFKATKPDSKFRGWLGLKVPAVIVLLCFLIQVIICITWLRLSPPFLEMNMRSSIGKIILECNENSQAAFYSMLGFLGLLACLSFLVAFQARKLPDSFNETKLITFSMMVFLSVWTSFIPAYLSTKGKFMVSVEIFAILTSSAGLLLCIFFPKCYIIIRKPEMNTRKHLQGKQ
ncbi:extracellular calcium-sensing receptor-like [Ambystoma mexicanum]|uniref:extracellular calcium-sensing receptor-like n=1 Tax=Ambystoma mexicanum TaxID=8296 RepID=UPI0037E7D2ED